MHETDPWSRQAIKTHLGAAFQTLERLRGDMLKAASPEADGAMDLAKALTAIGDHLNAEMRWLDGMGRIPIVLIGSARANFLRDYGQRVATTLQFLVAAVKTRPVDPEAFKPVGVSILQLMSLQFAARNL